ncbi:unnamed protein product [Brachionus calyciflorus]|uniref:Reverse transcriptase RNase H-like domain-containing protein n=1 Tax=Brachionus calyciflorus TaxID=104777 RepID=A0A814FSA1_9BILA|nr:unnamed protein product [Brachionus calyciflorus]
MTSKCKIASDETTFLGYKISSEGISIREDRIKTIKNYPRPTNGKKVKEFLGPASYYRQFIHNFAHIVEPLNKLTRKNIRFKWDENCQNAFKSLLNSLCNPPILAYPDFSKTFYLATDISNYGIGAVLCQKNDQDQERVIFYASRSLNNAERNYSTIERELLGIVYAVEKFRYYLYGTEFVIITDHNPLTYSHNLTLSSARLTRWRLKLAEYNFKIIYKKGKTHSNADPLSRIEHQSHEKEIHKEDLIETLVTLSSKSTMIEDKIKYNEDNLLKPINQIVLSTSKSNKDNQFQKFIKGNCPGLTQPNRQIIRFGECIRKVDKSGRTIFYLVTQHSHGRLDIRNVEKCLFT